MKRFISGILLLAVLAIVAAPAQAGVPGKSTVQGTLFFVSGASDYAATLQYRATDLWGLTLAGEWLSVGSASASLIGAGARYYLAPSTTYDPYLFAAVGTINVSVPGASASFSTTQYGVGASAAVTDTVTLKGAVGWVAVAGHSAFGYEVALNYDFTPGKYAAAGLSGGSGSSTFYVGLGARF